VKQAAREPASPARLGGASGEAWAEPCDLSSDLSGVALAKTEAIRAKGEAKEAIPSCPDAESGQGFLAKKGEEKNLAFRKA